MKRFLLSAAIVALLVPLTAQAAFLSGEQLSETTGDVAGDLYIASSTVSVRHAVRDDVFAAGEVVSVDARVGGDVMAAGNTVRVNGQADDDVMAAGNTVHIQSARVDDVFAAGASVEVAATTIAGSVFAAGERVRISGTVAGDVRAAGENIVIASGTKIAGNLITYGSKPPAIEDNVSVTGQTTHHQKDHKVAQRERRAQIGSWVTSVLTWFICGLALLTLLRGGVTEIIAHAQRRSARALGFGVLAAAVVLPLFILLAITIVGLPLAFVVLLGSGAHLIVAHTLAGIVVGAWVMARFNKDSGGEGNLRWQHVLLGTVLLRAIALVPIVGGVVVLIITLMTWGALLEVAWRRLRGAATPTVSA